MHDYVEFEVPRLDVRLRILRRSPMRADYALEDIACWAAR
jgi:hypothetical protein